jgi:hypothetical protein
MKDDDKKAVRVDWFLCDIAPAHITVTDELMESAFHHALQYLKVGQISWEKYSLLSEFSRFIFDKARAILDGEEVLPREESPSPAAPRPHGPDTPLDKEELSKPTEKAV